MHAFQYHRPASTKEALSLAQQKGEGRYLAGGQSLVQAMKLRLSSPSDLIDLGTIKDLSGIKLSGNAVEIGAMTRHAEVAASAEVKKAIPSKFAPEAVASIKVKPDGLNNDLHASPEYRAHLITVMCKRAVEAALK